MADIQLVGVSKRFGSVSVIERLSLSIRANEFVVFLGPSGCGKSTLLRMIAGLESVDEGEILIGGERIDHLPPGARGVAMVFQQYALYPHMTIYENMAFGLRNIGLPQAEIDARVSNAAKILEIPELLERKPGQLSGGQRQRVAIGRAIVKEPKAFLFDEPLSNLDAALRGRTRVELAQLHNRVRSTMIFVTHDQIEAMTLAHRIVVMNKRRIEQIGTPMEIYTRPATRFVAAFVGSPTMNFLPARVAEGARQRARIILRDGTSIATGIPLDGLAAADDVTFGIRAGAVTFGVNRTGDTKGKAEVIERLGDRTLVYARLMDGSVIVAEGDGDSAVAVGDQVPLSFDGMRGHLFDADGHAHHNS